MSDKLGSEEYIKKSRFKALDIPKFESTIPPELLEGKDEADKILYNSINVQNQQLEWLINSAKENNRLLRITNGRVNIIEEWKDKITSGWGIILGILTFSGSILGIIATILKLTGNG